MQEQREQPEATEVTASDEGSIDIRKYPGFLRARSKFSFGMKSDGSDEADPRQTYGNFGILGRTPTERKILFGTTTVVSLIAFMLANDQMKKSEQRAAVQRAADHSALQKKIAEEARQKEAEGAIKSEASALTEHKKTAENAEENLIPATAESVWTSRAPGEISKGEIIYSPVKGPDGKKKLVSLQFIDKDGQTLLIKNGKRWAQTSKGFPVLVKKIMLGADRRITITGVIMRALPGDSVWDEERISKLNDDLNRDGKSEFTVSTLLGDDKGLIQAYIEPEVDASEEAEAEAGSAQK